MATGRKDDEIESQRILRRVAQESDPSGASFVRRRAGRLKDHLIAADVDDADKHEVLGTIIGRTLGFIITLGLLGWIAYYLAGGG